MNLKPVKSTALLLAFSIAPQPALALTDLEVKFDRLGSKAVR